MVFAFIAYSPLLYDIYPGVDKCKFTQINRFIDGDRMSDFGTGVVCYLDMNRYSKRVKSLVGLRRTRFLASVILSSPLIVFVYSPLLLALTIAGIAVPFATGRFIDSLVGGMSPVAPFVLLAALLLVRSITTPCLQRFILSRSRDIELNLQRRVLDAVMDFSPSELAPLTDGTLVAKLTRDAYAVGGFVSGLYPRLLGAVVTMSGHPVLATCARKATMHSPCFSTHFAHFPSFARSTRNAALPILHDSPLAISRTATARWTV